MGKNVQRKYPRTNIYVIDQEAWDWAQYRAKRLGHRSVSEYLFRLIALDKERGLIEKVSQ